MGLFVRAGALSIREPSATLTDSDDYLVVELQRRDYEWENLQPGPVVAAKLAQSLAEWTTDYHRRNVMQTVVFHAADRPGGSGSLPSPGRMPLLKPFDSH